MPRLSTSNRAKDRVIRLVQQLLAYANHDFEDNRAFSRLVVRWLEPESSTPKLVVQATLEDLTKLVAAEPLSQIAKEQLRHDLLLLKEFLYILEDNRAKTQGAGLWHFTLKLWSASVEKNLVELERRWQQCKSQKISHSDVTEQKQPDHQLPQLHLESVSLLDRQPSQLYSNLPARDYTAFIGRIQPLNQLLDYLCFDFPVARIGIAGIAGIGKTSLALEAAHRCFTAAQEISTQEIPNQADFPIFDAIIFTSAKQHRLTTRGIFPSGYQERTLQRICRVILQSLDHSNWLSTDLDSQIERIQTILARRRVLLIIDNLETIEEEQAVSAFLYKLPATVKVILTGCDRSMLEHCIHLEPLSETEAKQFLQHQAQSKTIEISAGVQTLYEMTGGVPAAIVYAIGQVANGYRLPEVLPQLTLAKSEFCRFYFERSVQPLRGQSAHQLLMGLAFFSQPARREVITQIALPDAETAEVASGLARLCQLSLIILQDKGYTMLPLTRAYALAELREHPDFEQVARNRWVNWYLTFCQQYGHQKWREWHDYSALDTEWENVESVIDWCIEQERSEDFAQFWKYVKGYTHIYGHSGNRLNWMQWWIKTAEQQADHSTLAQAQTDHAWTLILMGKPDYLAEAEQLLQQAWESSHSGDAQFQLELSLTQGILCIHQIQFSDALKRLAQAKSLLSQVDFEAEDRIRYSTRIDYYKAEIWCRRDNHRRSKTLFHRVLKNARAMGWQQIEIYTLNWLAEIALAQTDLDQAEALLNQSLPIAQQQRDKRSIAFHARSQADLEYLRGNQLAAQRWREAAIASFTDLGMDAEVQDIQSRSQDME